MILWKQDKVQIFGNNTNKLKCCHEEIKNILNSGNAYYHLVFCLLICFLKSQKLKYGKLILPVVLFECDIWSLKLWEEHRIFQNRVLRWIFRSKREQVAGSWKNCVIMGFIMCTSSQILSTSSNVGIWDGWHLKHAWKRKEIHRNCL